MRTFTTTQTAAYTHDDDQLNQRVKLSSRSTQSSVLGYSPGLQEETDYLFGVYRKKPIVWCLT